MRMGHENGLGKLIPIGTYQISSHTYLLNGLNFIAAKHGIVYYTHQYDRMS